MFASPTRSALLSGLLHASAIVLILAATGVKPQLITKYHEVLLTPVDISAYKPELLKPGGGGGGGGGVHADSPASKGVAPPFAKRQFSLPVVQIDIFEPALPVAPTLIGDPDIKMAALDLNRWGDPNGVNGKLSGGPGKGFGIGDGEGTGVGPGKGPGLGPGEGGNEGGGGLSYGGAGFGGVTAPRLLTKTEPEYSEEARRSKLQGTVVLRIDVNTNGQAEHITVQKSLGLGLDQQAIDAVSRWRFQPGTVNGKPAVVPALVEVHFRLL